MDIPPICNDTVYLGVYLDAASEGPGATHERLTAFVPLAFSFDIDAWDIVPRVEEALSAPEPQCVTVTGGVMRVRPASTSSVPVRSSSARVSS